MGLRHGLGSNRAEYSRRRELMTHIAIARAAMQLSSLRLKDKKLAELEEEWRKTYLLAKQAGLIRG